MSTGSDQPKRDPHLKRKAWRTVFIGSALFWAVIIFAIWRLWG